MAQCTMREFKMRFPRWGAALQPNKSEFRAGKDHNRHRRLSRWDWRYDIAYFVLTIPPTEQGNKLQWPSGATLNNGKAALVMPFHVCFACLLDCFKDIFAQPPS